MDTYRKVALERLSSPEQVDEILKISSAREWIAFLAVFILLAATGIWSVVGSLPTKTNGHGVIVRTGGIVNVSTLHSGLLLSVGVTVGDQIKRNQVIARVAQPALLEQIRIQRMEIQEAERDRVFAKRIAMSQAALRLDALRLQRENALREIKDIQEQTSLAVEQIPVLEQLFAKGLVTRQQTVAGRQALVGFQQRIAAQQAAIKQYDSQKYEIEAAPGIADLERVAQIRHLQMGVGDLEQQLTMSEEVISPYSGQVIEMDADEGSVVQAGTAILSLEPELGKLQILVCVPSQLAKNIATNMAAEISPSQVRREEYGFIRGKVVYVAAYPAT